ncbi:hypothetical protein PN836_012005 [Ningiella sp. W23]|uniref:hypothetical protein n=1 Tax=Ningiella sp. W23 TaxID=3023715 RepID=UPI0037576D4B
MQTIFKPSRYFSLAVLVVAISVSSLTHAQISPYDSMYFPTTQSLEGTRNAPRIYEVVSVGFGTNANTSPQYFDGLKQAYSQNLALDYKTFFSSDPTSVRTLVDSAPSLSSIHQNVLSRISKASERSADDFGIRADINALDHVNANSFDFRNIKRLEQPTVIASIR